jgi:hypothetical protein
MNKKSHRKGGDFKMLFRISWINEMNQEETYHASTEAERDAKVNDLKHDGLIADVEVMEK